ncbi:MAG: hypothetical protein KJ822_16650 [Proteobacteria bacterium]|nr:hypothetical protein [Pseudomonadota bacterium]
MADDIVSKALVGAVVGGIFALIAWQLNKNKKVKLEQKNKKQNADKVTEGPFKEEKSEPQKPVLERKKVDLHLSDNKCPADLDIDEADLINETKVCSACKNTIKLLAKKCRFCGVIFEQNEFDKAIKSRSIEIIERKLEISLDEEVVMCPGCAELINIKSMECEWCREVFDPSEVENKAKGMIYRKRKGNKKCPICGKWSVHTAIIEDHSLGLWCPNCKKGWPS